MLKNNGCKCADGPVCSVPEFSDPSFAVASGQCVGESHIMFDLEDQGGINIDGKSSVIGHDFMAKVQFADVGWELDDYPDAMELSKMMTICLRCPVHYAQRNFSAKRMLGRI